MAIMLAMKPHIILHGYPNRGGPCHSLPLSFSLRGRVRTMKSERLTKSGDHPASHPSIHSFVVMVVMVVGGVRTGTHRFSRFQHDQIELDHVGTRSLCTVHDGVCPSVVW